MRRHLDYFAAHQTQLFVVVEHRVHVFDPHGVNWAVEDQPFPVRALLDTRGTGIQNNPLDVRKKKTRHHHQHNVVSFCQIYTNDGRFFTFHLRDLLLFYAVQNI